MLLNVPKSHGAFKESLLCIFFPGNLFYWPLDISAVLSLPPTNDKHILPTYSIHCRTSLKNKNILCLSTGSEESTACSTHRGLLAQLWWKRNWNQSPQLPLCVFIRTLDTGSLAHFFLLPTLTFFLWLFLALLHSPLPKPSRPMTMLKLTFPGSRLQIPYVPTWTALFSSQVTALLTFPCQRPECHLWRGHSSYQILEQFKGHKPKIFFRKIVCNPCFQRG